MFIQGFFCTKNLPVHRLVVCSRDEWYLHGGWGGGLLSFLNE